jgi:uncharacterized alpha-E superfamily protein
VALLQLLTRLEFLPPHLARRMPMLELEQELVTFLFKQQAPGGLGKTLLELRRIAALVRDRLSMDTWRILNQLHQDFRLRHGRIQFEDALAHLNRMITDLAAFSGMEMENMTRGHGWRFLDVGRRLERAINLTSLLRSALVGGPTQEAILEPLLEIADSTMTYRRRYFAQPQLLPVVDLLVSDDSNTRSIAFQLAALDAHASALPKDPKAPSPTQEQRLVAHAIGTLHAADIDALCRATARGQFPGVRGLLGAVEHDLRALSDAITYFYFSHAALRVS